MWACGATSAPHQRQHLPLLNYITHINLDRFAVSVTGNQAITMINLYQIAIAITLICVGYNATRYRDDVATFLPRKIDASMPGTLSGKRIGTVTITRG